MQETMNNLAKRLKKSKFYQIVFSIGKRVSKNELQYKERDFEKAAFCNWIFGKIYDIVLN